MKKYLLVKLALVLFLALFFTETSFASKNGSDRNIQSAYQVTGRALKIDVAYYTHWGTNPHHGAFFYGYNGSNQHYLGSGGDAATCSSNHGCINTWNWWSGSQNVLLLPKSWLHSYSARWNSSNYEATTWVCC
jgi:hypothetical protein